MRTDQSADRRRETGQITAAGELAQTITPQQHRFHHLGQKPDDQKHTQIGTADIRDRRANAADQWRTQAQRGNDPETIEQTQDPGRRIDRVEQDDQAVELSRGHRVGGPSQPRAEQRCRGHRDDRAEPGAAEVEQTGELDQSLQVGPPLLTHAHGAVADHRVPAVKSEQRGEDQRKGMDQHQHAELFGAQRAGRQRKRHQPEHPGQSLTAE